MLVSGESKPCLFLLNSNPQKFAKRLAGLVNFECFFQYVDSPLVEKQVLVESMLA